MSTRWMTCAPWRAVLLAVAAAVATAVPALGSLLALGSSEATLLEPWRWWTGHLIHGSVEHLTWDVLVLVGLGVLFEPVLGRRWWIVLVIAAPAVGLGTLAIHRELPSYGGLSGLLHAIWVAGALELAARERIAGRVWTARLFVACIAASLLKIGLETWADASLFVDPASLGGVPVPVAHAIGALCGALVVTAPRHPRSRRSGITAGSRGLCCPRIARSGNVPDHGFRRNSRWTGMSTSTGRPSRIAGR